MRKIKCPKCGSTNIARYLWGMPSFTPDLQEEIKQGKIILGGCCITEQDPQYHCNNCKKDFGNSPV